MGSEMCIRDSYVALYRARIAHVLVILGRDEEALEELEQAREVYGDAPKWKAARARVLAHRGRTAEAVALAREAAEYLAESDDITTRAEVLTDLAEVLRADGNRRGAGEALAEAIALHEAKGNVVNAERCRELLATIRREGSSPGT